MKTFFKKNQDALSDIGIGLLIGIVYGLTWRFVPTNFVGHMWMTSAFLSLIAYYGLQHHSSALVSSSKKLIELNNLLTKQNRELAGIINGQMPPELEASMQKLFIETVTKHAGESHAPRTMH